MFTRHTLGSDYYYCILPHNSWRHIIRKVTALPMEGVRTTYQHDPDDLIGQLVVNLLPQKDDALAVEPVVDVDPVRGGGPGNSVRHLTRATPRRRD